MNAGGTFAKCCLFIPMGNFSNTSATASAYVKLEKPFSYPNAQFLSTFILSAFAAFSSFFFYLFFFSSSRFALILLHELEWVT